MVKHRKRVSLIGILQHPRGGWDTEDYAACGARGCFSESSSAKIQKEEKGREDREKRRDIIFRETSGRGHGAVLDLAEFAYEINNLSRASTLFLCGPQYGEHLQQSLRRATAERGFVPVKLKGANEIMEKQFELYESMQSDNIPSEDARFILPLNTKTAITTKWNARELMHLYSMAQRMSVPNEVKKTIDRMYDLAAKEAPLLMKDRTNNLEVLAWLPSSQLFAKENLAMERIIKKYSQNKSNVVLMDASGKGVMTKEEIETAVNTRDEALLSIFKHYHMTFLANMSLASFHQATRQRTWDQAVQALPNAITRGNYITPKSIKGTKYENQYKELNEMSIEFVRNKLNYKESLGVIPHSLEVYDIIHVNGWNGMHSIGKRTCTEAQWEIRKIAKSMAKSIKEYDPNLGQFAVPQGVIYGKCPEKNPCGKCFPKNGKKFIPK